jgi:DNA-binding transcriptional LysR family regulator
VSLTVEEISSTEIETAIEEGRMDVGLGFLTRHSPRLRYERLYVDQFALIVAGTTHGRSGESSISPNCTRNACSNFPIAS